jgi:hypothetical protein
MKMRRRMILPVHGDNNSKKSTYYWHDYTVLKLLTPFALKLCAAFAFSWSFPANPCVKADDAFRLNRPV